jgi:hypothetical protein
MTTHQPIDCRRVDAAYLETALQPRRADGMPAGALALMAGVERERIAGMLGASFAGMGDRKLLTFNCAGRRLHLGEDAAEEIVRLRRETHAPRLVGALSLGEIGSLSEWRCPLFHNASLACRPW